MLKTIKVNEELALHELTQEEKDKRGILGRLSGPIASYTKATRNDRKYTEELWEKAFSSPLVKEMFENGGLIGQLEHPDTTEGDPLKSCILMREMPKKDNNGLLIGTVDILDTPCGKIVYALAKAGFRFGISSRGEGETYTDNNGNEIVDPDTYELKTFDLVELPACEDARLSFTESYNKKFNYKTMIQESMNNASEKDRKIMQETLDDLKINLNEAIEIDPSEFDSYVYRFFSIDNTQILAEFIAHDKEDANKQAQEFAKRNDIEKFEILNQPDCNGQDDIDQNVIAADDIRAIADQLQDALSTNSDMAKQIAKLQESISAGYTREKNLDNKVKSLSTKITRLAETAKNSNAVSARMQKENRSLNNHINTLNEQLKKSDINESECMKLQEQLSDKITEIRNLESEIDSLKGKMNSVNNEADKEIDKLKEHIEDLKKDSAIMNKQYERKLNEAMSKIDRYEKLTRKYKKLVNESINRYIASKADMLGCTVNDIKGRLNESYSFDDIDNACHDVQQYKINMSSLPFDIRNGKMMITESKKPSLMNFTDDTVDEQLLRMARLK